MVLAATTVKDLPSIWGKSYTFAASFTLFCQTSDFLSFVSELEMTLEADNKIPGNTAWNHDNRNF